MIQSDILSESNPGGRVENRLERVLMAVEDHTGGCYRCTGRRVSMDMEVTEQSDDSGNIYHANPTCCAGLGC